MFKYGAMAKHVAIVAVILIACLFALTLGFGLLPPPSNNPDDAALIRMGALVLGGGGLIAGSAYFVLAIRNRHRQVEIYENGICMVNKGHCTPIPWESINASEISLIGDYLFYFVKSEDARISVSGSDFSWRDVIEICNLVECNLGRLLAPKRLRDLSDGYTLAYGPIRIDAGGLKWKDKQIPWADIAQIYVDHRFGLNLKTRDDKVQLLCTIIEAPKFGELIAVFENKKS